MGTEPSEPHRISIEDIPLPSMLLDNLGRLVECNAAGRSLLGLHSGEQLKLRDFAEFISQAHRETLDALFRRVRQSGRGEAEEIQVRSRDGQEHFARLFSQRVESNGEDFFMISASLSDGRRRERDEILMLQEEAQRERERQSRIIAQLAGELRNPANSMYKLSTLLREALELSKYDTALNLSATLSKSAAEIRRLLENLGKYSALENGGKAAENVIFSFPAMLEDLSDRYSPLAADKNLGFFLRNTMDRPGLYSGDQRVLKQILETMLTNAIEFTTEGQVDMIVREDLLSDYLAEITVEVRDTGPGIDAELQRRLWNLGGDNILGRFGMGLPIARRLAGLINAQLYFETAKNMGTSFFLTVALPRSSEAALAISPMPESPLLAKLRILVAAANTEDISALINDLGDQGHIVVSSDNPEDLASSLEFAVFDAMIIDIDDENLGGAELVRQMKQRSIGDRRAQGDGGAIIAITEQISLVGPENPGTLPFDELVERPVEASTLLYLLSDILG